MKGYNDVPSCALGPIVMPNGVINPSRCHEVDGEFHHAVLSAGYNYDSTDATALRPFDDYLTTVGLGLPLCGRLH